MLLPTVRSENGSAPYQAWRTRAYGAERRAAQFGSTLLLMSAAIVLLVYLLVDGLRNDAGRT